MPQAKGSLQQNADTEEDSQDDLAAWAIHRESCIANATVKGKQFANQKIWQWIR